MKPKHKINVRSVIAHIVLILLSFFMPVLLCNTYNQCDKVACTAAEGLLIYPGRAFPG